MERDEWRFVLTLSGAHGMSHVFRRLLPPLIPVLALAYSYRLWELGIIVARSRWGRASARRPWACSQTGTTGGSSSPAGSP